MGELHVRSDVHRQGEISCIVHPRIRGQGMGTAIGRRLLAHGSGELLLHRIHATCDPRNLGSFHVLTMLGMTCEGRPRRTLLLRHGWRDSLVFSILGKEWRTSAATHRVHSAETGWPSRIIHVSGHPRRKPPRSAGEPAVQLPLPACRTGGKGAHPTHTLGATDA
ncbi:GNAT family protein [Streptomyces sp. NPDC001851]|uniref:GNAT family N-acetyltransferase n=1 Tax=Streptomyces sp. NPDC001851 TaxID=3154529 RepID=UPI00331B8B75